MRPDKHNPIDDDPVFTELEGIRAEAYGLIAVAVGLGLLIGLLGMAVFDLFKPLFKAWGWDEEIMWQPMAAAAVLLAVACLLFVKKLLRRMRTRIHYARPDLGLVIPLVGSPDPAQAPYFPVIRGAGHLTEPLRFALDYATKRARGTAMSPTPGDDQAYYKDLVAKTNQIISSYVSRKEGDDSATALLACLQAALYRQIARFGQETLTRHASYSEYFLLQKVLGPDAVSETREKLARRAHNPLLTASSPGPTPEKLLLPHGTTVEFLDVRAACPYGQCPVTLPLVTFRTNRRESVLIRARNAYSFCEPTQKTYAQVQSMLKTPATLPKNHQLVVLRCWLTIEARLVLEQPRAAEEKELRRYQWWRELIGRLYSDMAWDAILDRANHNCP